MSKPKFIELSKAPIQHNRFAVISKAIGECENLYTLGQYVAVEEGKRNMNFFVKGGLQISSLDQLVSLRDALNEAIEKEMCKKE